MLIWKCCLCKNLEYVEKTSQWQNGFDSSKLFPKRDFSKKESNYFKENKQKTCSKFMVCLIFATIRDVILSKFVDIVKNLLRSESSYILRGPQNFAKSPPYF